MSPEKEINVLTCDSRVVFSWKLDDSEKSRLVTVST